MSRGARQSDFHRMPPVPTAAEELSAAQHVRTVIAANESLSAAPIKPSSRVAVLKGFRFDRLSQSEKVVAPVLGVYLGFAVARIHELFPILDISRLLMSLMVLMFGTLVTAVPGDGWARVWKASPQLRLVALLAVIATVTCPLGIWVGGSINYLITRYTVALAVFVACLLLFRDRSVMRRIMVGYVAVVTIVAATTLSMYVKAVRAPFDPTLYTADQLKRYEETGIKPPVRQSFGTLDPNDLAAVMATTFPIALWLATGAFRRKMIWYPAAGLLATAVVPTASRGGLLGLVMGAGALGAFGSKGWRRWMLIGILVVGGLGFMAFAGEAQMDRFGDMGGGDYNYSDSEGRIAIWKRGIVWMTWRPWGYGMANFPIWFGWLNGPYRAAHNSLIQYGVELGVAGLAVYVLTCYTIAKSLGQIRRRASLLPPSIENTETIQMTGHVLAMMVACWVTGFFLSNAYYPITYMALGTGSAIILGTVNTPAWAEQGAAASASMQGPARGRAPAIRRGPPPRPVRSG